MYTLSRSIQWLAQEAHVKEECGPYSTKPGALFSSSGFACSIPNTLALGYPVPDWPTLLHLYSRMKPGKTVFEWLESHSVHELGIDVRRFTSFGVVKVGLYYSTLRLVAELFLGVSPSSPSVPRLFAP